MENASKALIIAGAILLAISIIGIGMYVFSQAQGAMDGIGMDEERIDAYNSKFESYTGTNVRGTTVRALFDLVRNHNISVQGDTSLLISIDGATEAAAINEAKAKILSGQTYNVQVTEYDATTGYIKAISTTGGK